MRLFSRLFVLLAFTLLYTATFSKTFAETVFILFDKSSYTIGQNIGITLSTLPKATEASYNLVVFPGAGIKGGNYVALVVIKITHDLDSNRYHCRFEVNNPKDAWISTSCNPADTDDAHNFTFNGTLNGNKIGADPNSVVDMYYSVVINSNISGTTYSPENFVIKAPKQSSGFIIDKITSGGSAIYTAPGPANAGVAPGATIGITFSPAINGKRYVWGKNGDPNNPSGTCTTQALSDQCTKNYVIPSNTPIGQFDIGVLESDSNKLALASISVTGATQNPPGLDVSAAPTHVPYDPPKPPPPAPLPPCSAAYRNTNGDFLGCDAVSTSLGMSISTNPASFIADIFSILLSLSGGVAILLIIRSGYKLMTSQGDPEKVKEAREVLTSAIVGLLFLIFSLIVLEIIGVDILHIPGLRH